MEHLGPYALNTVHAGRAEELGEAVPDHSVDLILCDPVYDSMPQYMWLVEWGARVLKLGGNLVAQCGHHFLPGVYASMIGRGLDYVWTLSEHLNGVNAGIFNRRVIVKWKPWVWFSMGATRKGDWMFDEHDGGGRDKQGHKWGDSPRFAMSVIHRLTEPGDIVVDPFTGGGSVPIACKALARKWLAFEINAGVAAHTQQRIGGAQSPLLVVGAEGDMQRMLAGLEREG